MKTFLKDDLREQNFSRCHKISKALTSVLLCMFKYFISYLKLVLIRKKYSFHESDTMIKIAERERERKREREKEVTSNEDGIYLKRTGVR